MKAIQEKIEQAKIFDMPDALHGQVYEFTKSELLSLLKEVAEKAFNVGYDQIEYPAETAFADYWKSVTDKIK